MSTLLQIEANAAFDYIADRHGNDVAMCVAHACERAARHAAYDLAREIVSYDEISRHMPTSMEFEIGLETFADHVLQQVFMSKMGDTSKLSWTLLMRLKNARRERTQNLPRENS